MWARLHFGDGGTLDLPQPMDDWERDRFEHEWQAVHVRVEWLHSPRGRLDRAIRYVTTDRREVDDSAP